MLKYHMLQDQTLNVLIEEAKEKSRSQVKEWANFKEDDPALKILEELTTFSVLQQANIESIPETVQEKIFLMAGFQKESRKSARVLIDAGKVEKKQQIPSGQRFKVGDLYFETNKNYTIRGNRLTGIYTKTEDGIRDISYVLDEHYPMAGEVFTREPKIGMEICFVMDDILTAGEDLIFYINAEEEFSRNPSEGKNIFAHIKWQIYTKRGFIDIRCKDTTESFVTSGELSFHIPKDEIVIYDGLPKSGYLIRGILNRAEYDCVPKIKKISSFLFEAWQKETKSVCYTYSGKKQVIDLYCNILEKGCMQIYAKEKQDEGYRLYAKETEAEDGERFYNLERSGYGKYRVSFEKTKYKPGKFENAVKILLYDEDMTEHYELGCVYGYDNQKMMLPAGKIVKESFSIFVERQEEGEKKYYFIRPESSKQEELYYKLNEKEGYLVIEDARDFIGSKVYLGGCTVSQGTLGNIRENCIFEPLGEKFQAQFTNPAVGKGGSNPEGIEDVRQRLIQDLKKHYTAVEAEDYEELVKNTPALCIDKVKAIRDESNHCIRIAVKPESNERFPKLSETYQKAIRIQLEKARLLSVDVKLCQPVYVPVDVTGVIFVKTNSQGCRKQIEDIIFKQLDYQYSEHNFGERFCFDTLFHKIESLECVKYIYDLSISLSEQLYALQEGFDIQPMDHCLLYPGDINLVLKMTE